MTKSNFVEIIYKSKEATRSVELLKEIMDDKANWIDWYIYDTNYGENKTEIYDKNDKIIADIKTAEDLYDYLKKGE